MGMDKRIGKEFLQAGAGYGGFCFPKDVEAFAYISKKLGYDFNLLKEVEKINEEQRHYFVEKVKEHLWVLKDKKIAILGLSFKPDTDDMRFAPSIDIVNDFVKEGSEVILYDPEAQKEAVGIFKALSRVKFAKGPYEAVSGCDCACFLTEWEEFKKLDLARIKKLMKYPLIADGRNMFDKITITRLIALPEPPKYEYYEVHFTLSENDTFANAVKEIEIYVAYIRDNVGEPSPEIPPTPSDSPYDNLLEWDGPNKVRLICYLKEKDKWIEINTYLKGLGFKWKKDGNESGWER